jgi:hypothetical protein
MGKEKVKELLEHLVSVPLLATRISQEVSYWKVAFATRNQCLATWDMAGPMIESWQLSLLWVNKASLIYWLKVNICYTQSRTK